MITAEEARKVTKGISIEEAMRPIIMLIEDELKTVDKSIQENMQLGFTCAEVDFLLDNATERVLVNLGYKVVYGGGDTSNGTVISWE